MEFLGELHPKVVHFPVAVLILYPLIETAGILFKKDFLSKTAHLLLFLGVLTAIAAVLTGRQAFDNFNSWTPDSELLMNDHEIFATISVWYFSALLVIRTFLVLRKKFTGVISYALILLALAGGYFIYQTADYGGKLVFKFGVGTEIINSDVNDN
ncbi:MAG: hypothetical protein Kow0098_27920 [Ignavibacteriaceae bacterium]